MVRNQETMIRRCWQRLCRAYSRFIELLSEDDIEIYPDENYDKVLEDE